MTIHNYETVVASTNDIEILKTLRTNLLNRFEGLWWFLYKEEDKYQLTVATCWCGKVSDTIAGEIKKVSNQFLRENNVEFKDMPDEVSAFLQGVDIECSVIQ